MKIFEKTFMCQFYYSFNVIAFYNLNSFIFRLKNCLQEGDDIPNDHTKLFDLSLYKMDNNVLPDVLRFIVMIFNYVKSYINILRYIKKNC